MQRDNMKMTRWLLTAFVLLTIAGTAALSMSGCDDDSGETALIDMTVEHDSRSAHD